MRDRRIISHSMNLLGFPKHVQEASVYLCFQSELVHLFFVVCVAQFHASLPALEMLLGFLLGEVKMSNSLCFQAQKKLAHDAAVQLPKASSPTLAVLSILSSCFSIMPVR